MQQPSGGVREPINPFHEDTLNGVRHCQVRLRVAVFGYGPH